MAATGYTSLVIYNSSTASSTPSAVNLLQGELALNVTDKRLFTKDAGGNVVLVGVDLSTAQTLTNKTLTGAVENAPTINGYTDGVVTANTTTAYTINIASASVQILTLTGSCTYTFPAATAGKSFLLVQKQDATGSRTVTWPVAVKWSANTAPTLTATANKADLFGFTSDGTYWYGRAMGGNFL